ncbi:hypothetical protein SOP87_28840, partial [Bacillus cereus]|uniref:hypothetical protein n=2 Tax=Bacillaceae TaxID=186817 RepID=UPI002B250DBB
MNTDIEEMVKSGNLPVIMKKYFLDSKRIKSFLSKNIIFDIEELYLLYSVLYEFNEAQFTQKTIDAIERCKDKNTFYFYLKKILDVDLEIKLRNTPNFEENRLFEQSIKKEEIYSVSNDYIEIINEMYERKPDIDIKIVYQTLGRLEAMCKLTDD